MNWLIVQRGLLLELFWSEMEGLGATAPIMTIGRPRTQISRWRISRRLIPDIKISISNWFKGLRRGSAT
jgi:hypothetical protein